MSDLYFDAWAAATPNGTSLGEITKAYGKSYRAVHQGMGWGEFTINRHDAQAAWAATDNLIRVRRVTGGPFAYDSANYIGAFWIEGGDDTLLSSDEEGGEDITRGGRSAEACLRWAILYPDAFDSRNDKFATKTRIDGNWHIDDRTAGEVLAIFLRDLDNRTPDPLPFISKDFGLALDTNDVAWTDTGTDWQIPVGTSGLSLLETCVSGGLYYRVTPAFLFHAYETEPGADLSATIAITKGVNITESAERQVYARETVGRVVVQGTKESGKLKYREVVDATTETALPGRREGFTEFRRTPTNAKLDRAGLRAIRRSKRRHDGVPTVRMVEATGKEAFVNFVPGDILTLSIDTEYAAVAKRVYSITLEEDEAGNVDPVLEFEQSPFDPATNRDGDFEEGKGGNGSDGGTNCGDCPPIPPFVPGDGYPVGTGSCFDDDIAITAAGTYGGNGSATTQSPGNLFYFKPGQTMPTPFVPTTGWVGAWNFPDYPNNAAGDNVQNQALVVVAGAGTLTITVADYAGSPHTFDASILYGAFPGTAHSTVTGLAAGSHDFVIPDDAHCYHWVSIGDDASVSGGKWQFVSWTWVPTSEPDSPLEGQRHVEETAGDGTTTAYTTNYPYAPGSLVVHVNGVLWPVTETSPTAGTFTFASAPPLDAVIIIDYQNAGTTATGATNTVPVASTPASEPAAAAHVADTSDAHDASAVSVLDTAVNFTGDNVEAVLAELQDNIDALALDDLADVGASTPADGDVLSWDDYLAQWVPAAAGGGSGAVATDAIWDAAGDLAVGSGADTAARLAKGTDGQVLTVDPTTHLIVWATPSAASGDVATDTIWDAKGDLAGGTGANTAARLAVGTNGHVLTADAAETTGMKWATAGSGSSIPEQEVPYPTSASGDDDLMASTAGWTDVGADAFSTFSSDGKILSLIVLGASKSSAIRKTLGTTKAAAFDFRLGIFPQSQWWSSPGDTPITWVIRDSGGTQIAAMRLANREGTTTTPRYYLVGGAGSGAFTDGIGARVVAHSPLTLRCTRDGSNVIRFYFAIGSTPFALEPLRQSATPYAPLTFTSSGTVERIEIGIVTPSGPGASAEFGAKLDYFQSA